MGRQANTLQLHNPNQPNQPSYTAYLNHQHPNDLSASRRSEPAPPASLSGYFSGREGQLPCLGPLDRMAQSYGHGSSAPPPHAEAAGFSEPSRCHEPFDLTRDERAGARQHSLDGGVTRGGTAPASRGSFDSRRPGSVEGGTQLSQESGPPGPIGKEHAWDSEWGRGGR